MSFGTSPRPNTIPNAIKSNDRLTVPQLERSLLFMHCDIAALGGKQPEQGCKLGIDEDGFVRSYYVASSVCEMGMLRVELEAIDE